MNILVGSFMRRIEYIHNTMCNHEKRLSEHFCSDCSYFRIRCHVNANFSRLYNMFSCWPSRRNAKVFSKKILMHDGSLIVAAQNNCKCYLHYKNVSIIANQGWRKILKCTYKFPHAIAAKENVTPINLINYFLWKCYNSTQLEWH